eukprot:TRINITY_DN14699_c0_g1_i1.p1 TRINITY_DN14699_c0_g1~~TRINITY_DN14699_c0_g1_i1.p1  ORF type:complete len:546 (+),score=132.55 TRINITY_DN14699_c0_g1_i1:51-1688(+)
MTAELTPEQALEHQKLHFKRVSMYKEILEDKEKIFFDVVVITSADEEQTTTFKMNIDSMLEQQRIPSQTEYHVIPDPPGRKVGCGGATFYVLDELAAKYKDRFAHLKVLLIHAGGYSKRLPNHSHCGKIYSLLPVPSIKNPKAALSMLELKLACFTHVATQIPEGKGGVLVTCSDDLIFYDHTQCDFTKVGFTAFGHPGSVTIGKDHGVFVLEEVERDQGPGLAKCLKFIHKNTTQQQAEEGAIVGKTMAGEPEVYTDSSYFFSEEVGSVLLQLFEKVGKTIKAEVDAYGDFMQCLGPKRTEAYMRNYGNTSNSNDDEERENLYRIRKTIYDALAGFDLNCLKLPNSRFYHVGTMKEVLHHYCNDTAFLTCLGKSPLEGNSIIESLVDASSIVKGPSVVEYSRVPANCTVSEGSIVSGVDLPPGTSLPAKLFIQTLPVKSGFVTHVLSTDDDIKKATDELLLFGFCASKTLSLPTASLWTAKLYPVKATAAESLKCALEMHAACSAGKAPTCWQDGSQLLSLAECVTGKALEVQLELRKKLLSEL